jgi:hypothetical protein
MEATLPFLCLIARDASINNQYSKLYFILATDIIYNFIEWINRRDSEEYKNFKTLTKYPLNVTIR